MRNIRHGKLLAATGLAVVISALTGCQAQIAGMTLPSGYYLEHPPQYFPQEPSFPLQKELATQEAINSQFAPGGGVAPAGPIPGQAGPPPAANPPQ